MKTRRIAIRFDDICDTMNWENFNRAISICEKYNVMPLLGIVPLNKDKKLIVDKPNKDFYSIMLNLIDKGCCVAQHGYDHVYRNKYGGILNLNKQSEFVGESKETQKKYLELGKKELEKNKIYTNIYMAPSHSYDKNTVLALKELGFEYVTDGYTNYNYIWKGVGFIPCKNAYTLNKKDCGVVTLCVHVNSMNENKFEIFEDTLKRFQDELIDFQDLIKLNYRKVFKLKQWLALLTKKIKLRVSNLLNRG